MELRFIVREIHEPVSDCVYKVVPTRILQYRTQQTATWLDVPLVVDTGTDSTLAKKEST